ncbi:hypothetical protein BO86DRAFT_238649 [Aspergillus japonicus CBS 114.51]|uniref:Uncharacterized protein n=1 Tax=Aspergillus japonicus CBS 114.51 TaxID=1448312 RepID=A0A8T8WLS3_ASPJA|nr:hypothetical protein BO86DRAFT_238649 [Aspergillus japonicus CBS 114.51]RAH76805.1 hypothetical protein BO86DRAFT_238649 [Aspergillus japonicus CBS 114.51]
MLVSPPVQMNSKRREGGTALQKKVDGPTLRERHRIDYKAALPSAFSLWQLACLFPATGYSSLCLDLEQVSPSVRGQTPCIRHCALDWLSENQGFCSDAMRCDRGDGSSQSPCFSWFFRTAAAMVLNLDCSDELVGILGLGVTTLAGGLVPVQEINC